MISWIQAWFKLWIQKRREVWRLYRIDVAARRQYLRRHDPAIEFRIVTYKTDATTDVLFRGDCEQIRLIRKFGAQQCYDMDAENELWGSLLYPKTLGLDNGSLVDVQVRLIRPYDRKALGKWT